jgi:hypothetical protein
MSLARGLARDVGCRADLLWRCDLLQATQSSRWVESAVAAGFMAVPGGSGLGVAVLEDPASGNRVVVVLRTGRVQIRLDSLVPKSARVQQAQDLFDRLAQLGSRSASAPAEAG